MVRFLRSLDVIDVDRNVMLVSENIGVQGKGPAAKDTPM